MNGGFFELLLHTITFMGTVILVESTLTTKRARHVSVAIWFLNWLFVFGGYVLLYRLGIRDWLLYYLLSLSSFFLYFVLFEEGFAQNLFILAMLWGFASFLSSLCNWVTYWLHLGDSAIVVRCFLYLSFYAILIPLYRRYWRQSIRATLALFRKGTSIYALFPFVAFVIYVSLFGPMTETTSLRWFGLMMLFEFLIIFTYYLLFSHFRLIYDHLRAEDRLEGAEQQRLLQKKYYEEVDRGVRAQAKLLHDSRHHLLALASLAHEGDPTAVEAYVEQLLENFGSSKAKRYCEHSVANAVIGAYIDMAENLGVSVSTDIDLPQSIEIDEYQLCALFGNTIENAIDACRRIPEASPLFAKRYNRGRVETGGGPPRVSASRIATKATSSRGRMALAPARAPAGVSALKASEWSSKPTREA